MKILRIRLTNLNSLKGEHCVDLTREPLSGAGLFAITGPTGAGKTTLLDAVTLALYGKAARYGNDANPEDMMSRHCGECSAEVEFEVPTGVYRAVWERHRARKKADGALQPPKRYVYDATGEVLAQKIGEADGLVENLIGLNYDRFLRSVLLAQGDFARFLKANANERADLLESLTGTVIYSRLGRLAHEEAGRREDQVRQQEEAIQRIAILDDEELRALEDAIAQGDRKQEELTATMEKGSGMLVKIVGLEGARTKEKGAAGELRVISEQRKAAAADLERLRVHRLTIPFAEDLGRLEGAESASKRAEGKRRDAEKNCAAAVEEVVRTNHALRTAVNAELASLAGVVKEAEETITKQAMIASEASAWLDKHKKDAVLAHQIGDLAAGLGDLKNARDALAASWSDWRGAALEAVPVEGPSLPPDLEGASGPDLDARIDAFLVTAEARKGELEAEGKRAKKEHERRKDHLQKARLIARLEDHRHTLESGLPCPLCGALEHPYADGAVPNEEIADLEDGLKEAEDTLEGARERFRALARTLKSLSDRRQTVLQKLQERDATRTAAAELLAPIGEELPRPGDERAFQKALTERGRNYRRQAEALREAQESGKEAKTKLGRAGDQRKDLQTQIEKLPPLPEGADRDDVGTGGRPSVDDARERHHAAVQGDQVARAQWKARQQDAVAAHQALDAVQVPLQDKIAASEFETLEALRNARLEPDAAGKIESIDKDLADREAAATGRLREAQKDIAASLEEKVLEGDAAAKLKADQATLKEERDDMLRQQATRRKQLADDVASRRQRRESERALKDQEKELTVWRRLRELIGSFDGSKFRRHAQTISLDILTRHANRHLEKLSDRYRICRDEHEILNLQIEDLHQAGVRRPMASLSGGESFLASLALALGLSDLAGRTVRIESLFIDEGFGALDPDSLEVAIAALESLRQDQKTVGVISHVALLKERIGTQIVVDKLAGGVSRIRVIPAVAS